VDLKSSFAVHIFPNPATDLLYVTLPYRAASGTLTLIAPDGKIRLRQVIGGTTTSRLNVKGLAPGAYLLKYADGAHTWSGKVLVE
jgi:hypothetical protein